MKKYDVVSLGELLIDFTESGRSDRNHPLFEANPGGAPCNVLSMLNKCGRKTAYIGKVGSDIFGMQLKTALEELHIDTSNLILDPAVPTTLAFVQTTRDGDRDFVFYRNPGADMMLTPEEVKADLLKDTNIFHFGSISMTHTYAREATRKAITIAKEHNSLISFDPNLRKPLWKDLNDAREQITYGFTQCDILKISDNELVWYTGEKDLFKAAHWLKTHYEIPLLLLTMGREGSCALYKNTQVKVSPFLHHNTIDTTGAGDTFLGCCLNKLLAWDFYSLDEIQLKEMLTFANAAASIVTTRRGALRVMPNLSEIHALCSTH